MKKIKIAAGLAHVDYGHIADLVKKATSAPEIKADETNNPIRTKIEIILSLSMGFRK